MTTHGPDFMKDYQGFAQQAWDAWSRSLQPSGGSAPFASAPFGAPPSPQPTVDEAMQRSLTGFRDYLAWLQSAAGSGLGQRGGDWQQQVQQMFGGSQSPFAQAFGGIGSPSVQGFAEQWQRWMAAAQPAGFGDMRSLLQAPAFGYHREQQEQQQALQRAMLDHLEASKRYQELMLRAQMEGADRLQKKLAERARDNQPLESLKALYDLWIDCAEEAYAEIALSDEFREVYGAQVNTQMRVRKLQKEQLEALCRELGMPTTSEVESLGKRLQELRRELRQMQQRADGLRTQAAERPATPASRPAVKKAKSAPSARRDASTRKSAKAASRATTSPSTKARTKATPKTPARNSSRKRR